MKKLLLAALVAAMALFSASTASAETVTEADVTRALEGGAHTDGWTVYRRVRTSPQFPTPVTTPESAATFVEGPANLLGSPYDTGSLRLATADGNEKTYAFTNAFRGQTLSSVAGEVVSYETYRSAGTAQQVAALNVQIDLNGFETAGGFSTLVFEPVYNTAQGAVVNDQWQTWNASGAGRWWSTAAINGQCPGANACMKTWDEIVANNPDAVIALVGVNQGSGNAGLVSNVDAFRFGGETTDFEANDDADGDTVRDGSDNCIDDANTDQADHDGDGVGTACDEEELPSTPADCKKGNHTKWTPAFKNQGDCVSSLEPQKKA